MTKVFVFDLDDTLLNRSKRIGNDTLRELLRRVAVGDHIIFATSRPVRAVRYLLDSELLSHADVISLNGAIHHSADGKVTQHAYIGDKVKVLVANENILNATHIYLESTGEYFASNAVYTDQELEKVHFTTRDKVIPLDNFDIAKTSKVALDGLGNNIEYFSPYIHNLGLKPVPCLDGSFINVLARDCDKSTTLMKLMDSSGMHLEDTVIFGDDLPDIEMMKIGGVSVAMANAREEVKQVADVIIGDCDDDIIGVFIREHFTK
jgi:Cof subfamily protein (haloacid dehalogenase superfamily)